MNFLSEFGFFGEKSDQQLKLLRYVLTRLIFFGTVCFHLPVQPFLGIGYGLKLWALSIDGIFPWLIIFCYSELK